MKLAEPPFIAIWIASSLKVSNLWLLGIWIKGDSHDGEPNALITS